MKEKTETQNQKICGNCIMFVRKTTAYSKRGECAYFGTKVSSPKKIEQVDGADCTMFKLAIS